MAFTQEQKCRYARFFGVVNLARCNLVALLEAFGRAEQAGDTSTCDKIIEDYTKPQPSDEKIRNVIEELVVVTTGEDAKGIFVNVWGKPTGATSHIGSLSEVTAKIRKILESPESEEKETKK